MVGSHSVYCYITQISHDIYITFRRKSKKIKQYHNLHGFYIINNSSVRDMYNFFYRLQYNN